MQKDIKRYTVIVIGVVFLLIGLAGLVLPVLQGILFLAIGLVLLSMYIKPVERFLERITLRFPKLHKVVQKVERWAGRVIGER